MSLFVSPFSRATDANGNPLSGALLYFYNTSTTTAARIFTTSARTVAHTNPVVADANGLFPPIYLDPAVTYRAVLKTAGGVTVQDIDPYIPDQRESKTPLDFGATPYTPGTSVDSTEGLQAFFDFFRTADNARRYVGDWSGEWLISDTIWANFSNSDTEVPGPTFVCGTLRVAPIASLPGGAPLDTALHILGYQQRWTGEVGICPSGAAKWSANTTYTDRRFKVGAYIRAANSSIFDGFRIYDSMRDAVWIDSQDQNPDPSLTSFTVREGSAQETTYANSNCIGVQLGPIHTRTTGSQHKSLAKYGFTTSVSAKSHGTGDGASFAAGGGSNSNLQRTRLTVGSTTNMVADDMGKMRHEISASTFGTIAVALTTGNSGTMTWSSGNPVTEGLAVGDIYYVENTDSSSTNESIGFEVTGFSGGSNRVIAFVAHIPSSDVTLTADAARATLALVSDWTFHTVTNVTNATTMEVYPFVPNRHNSLWYHICGASLKISGPDAAWITVPAVDALYGGVGVWIDALYGPKIGSAGVDFSEIGIRIGAGPGNDSSLGLSVSHAHLEGATWQVYCHTSNALFDITGNSAFTLEGVTMEGPRTASTDLYVGSGTFGAVLVNTSDEFIFNPRQTRYEGTHGSGASVYAGDSGYYVSNSTRYRHRAVHTDTATVEVRYDQHLARNFAGHHWAEVLWTDDDGSAPDGTLTLNLHQDLIDKGWTFAGLIASGTTGALTGIKHVWLEFLQSTKKVAISAVPHILKGSATYDPPSIASGAIAAATTVTVTGAALGDHVRSVSFSLDTQGVDFSNAWVSAANTVSVRPANPTAGTIDLASGTLRVIVEKA